MKILKVLFLFGGLFFFASCGGGDEAPEGCVICKLAIPLLTDCEVTICDDAANDKDGDAVACVTATTIVGGSGTRAERVAELEALGFTCN